MSKQTANTGNPAEREVNGVNLDILEGTIGAISGDPALGQCHFRVSNAWKGGTRNSSSIDDYYGAGRENRHQRPFILHADVPRGFTDIRIRFEVEADVDDLEQLRSLTAFSPVFSTLTEGTSVNIEMTAA